MNSILNVDDIDIGHLALMKLTLPPFDRASISVVGDVMLDKYWYGDSSRISPEAPVPVVNVSDTEERPGGAANVALNLSALGARTQLYAITGNDENSASLQLQLTSADIACFIFQSPHVPTITKQRVISRNQQVIRMDFESLIPPEDSDKLFDLSSSQNSEPTSLLILSDYAKGTLRDPQQWIQLAKSRQQKVLVDPKGNDFSKYRGATLLKPNMKEFEAIVGRCATDHEIADKGHRLMNQLELGALLITRSSKGMLLLQPGRDPFQLPAFAHEVYDVTGAGDTVIAVLAACLASGQSLEEATAIANMAASIVVTKQGTATVSVAELRAALDHGHDSSRGIVGLHRAQTLARQARQQGQRIVFTHHDSASITGGDVQFLETAKRLGDRLIVAITSGSADYDVSLEQAAVILSALSCVDWVLPIANAEVMLALQTIQPDVIVASSDTTSEWSGAQSAWSWGAELRVIDNTFTSPQHRSLKGSTIEP